jgi:hypothetical protein
MSLPRVSVECAHAEVVRRLTAMVPVRPAHHSSTSLATASRVIPVPRGKGGGKGIEGIKKEAAQYTHKILTFLTFLTFLTSRISPSTSRSMHCTSFMLLRLDASRRCLSSAMMRVDAPRLTAHARARTQSKRTILLVIE